jgi:transcriptional regulator with XRE-family HTH domain
MSVNMTQQTQTNFGERVRRRRTALGMTQEQLAAKVGMNRPDLSDIENGKHSPTLKTIERLADALDVPPSALVDSHQGL